MAGRPKFRNQRFQMIANKKFMNLDEGHFLATKIALRSQGGNGSILSLDRESHVGDRSHETERSCCRHTLFQRWIGKALAA